MCHSFKKELFLFISTSTFLSFFFFFFASLIYFEEVQLVSQMDFGPDLFWFLL